MKSKSVSKEAFSTIDYTKSMKKSRTNAIPEPRDGAESRAHRRAREVPERRRSVVLDRNDSGRVSERPAADMTRIHP